MFFSSHGSHQMICIPQVFAPDWGAASFRSARALASEKWRFQRPPGGLAEGGQAAARRRSRAPVSARSRQPNKSNNNNKNNNNENVYFAYARAARRRPGPGRLELRLNMRSAPVRTLAGGGAPPPLPLPLSLPLPLPLLRPPPPPPPPHQRPAAGAPLAACVGGGSWPRCRRRRWPCRRPLAAGLAARTRPATTRQIGAPTRAPETGGRIHEFSAEFACPDHFGAGRPGADMRRTVARAHRSPP